MSATQFAQGVYENLVLPVTLYIDKVLNLQEATKKDIYAKEQREEYEEDRVTEDKNRITLRQVQDLLTMNTNAIDSENKEAKAKAELMKFLSNGFMKLADTFKTIGMKSFEVLETIYKKLSAASPLLQAIEQLFNLAWTIFFMPIGNKIGELLIPAVIQLMDDVTSFWEEYGEGGLGEMVSAAVEWGINALADFFSNIGDALASQTGLVGQIGSFLQGIGKFIESHGEQLLNTVLSWAMWNIEHLGTIVALIGSFMTLHYALQLGTMAVIAAASPTPHSNIAAGLTIAAVVTGLAGTAISWDIGSKLGLAKGGYVPAVEGGEWHLLGEGGEGEYVIPESKVKSLEEVNFRNADLLGSRLSDIQALQSLEPVIKATVEPSLKNPIEGVVRASVEPELQSPLEGVLKAAVEPDLKGPIEGVMRAAVEPYLSEPFESVMKASVQPELANPIEGVVKAAVEPDLQSPLEAVLKASVEPDMKPLETAIKATMPQEDTAGLTPMGGAEIDVEGMLERVSGAAKKDTYIVNIYAYTREDLEDKVREIMSGEISASRLRSGF